MKAQRELVQFIEVRSACDVERSFFSQKSILSLTRTRLAHDKVTKRMFVHMTIKFMDSLDMREEDLHCFSSVLTERGESGGATNSVGEGGRGLETAEECVSCVFATPPRDAVDIHSQGRPWLRAGLGKAWGEGFR